MSAEVADLQSLLDRAAAVGDDPAARAAVAAALLSAVESGAGDSKQRLAAGMALGELGDPRLRTPEDADYWVGIAFDGSEFSIGRFPVTNFEYRKFVDAGGYTNDAVWSEDGLAWRDKCVDPWPVRAASADSARFVVPNQPVVGVNWFEAEAYATAHGARLLRFDERLWVVRGAERRPYPWGSPFGEGNANTREEVLGRPCAVGLFLRDRTPEGVCDLAGNAAEWTAEGIDDERWIHPGSWDQPSMAAWAKARSLEARTARWAGLGFRLARDS